MAKVRFQVLTAANVKFSVFMDVAPRSQVEVDHHQGNPP
jgi:hypothetical protein